MAESQSPPWGSLPLERYVLAKWSSSGQSNLDARLRQLSRQFVLIGTEDRAACLSSWEGSDMSGAELQDILLPLRSESQRAMALASAFGHEDTFGILWLRTSYGKGTDEKHRQLISSLNADLALDMRENILSDEKLYNYGDDWQKIFEVMPERLFCISSDASSDGAIQEIHERNKRLRSLLQDFESGKFDEFQMEEASQRQFAWQDTPRTDDEIAASIFRVKTKEIHLCMIENYLFVADATALQTGKVLIVFFDERGRTVRQARMLPEECDGTAGAWADSRIEDHEEFSEGEIGLDYKEGGICGPPGFQNLVNVDV